MRRKCWICKSVTHRDPLLFACPLCGAEPHAPCVGRGDGRETLTHVARCAVARQAELAANDARQVPLRFA